MEQFDAAKYGHTIGRIESRLEAFTRELDQLRSAVKDSSEGQGQRIGKLEDSIGVLRRDIFDEMARLRESIPSNGVKAMAKTGGIGAGAATVIWWLLEMLAKNGMGG